MVILSLSSLLLASLLATASPIIPLPNVTTPQQLTTIPISRNRSPLSFSSLVKDLKRVQSLSAKAVAPAVNEDVTYIVEPTIGGKKFKLILDTGSSNTWVGAKDVYNSTSRTATGNRVAVSYGSGQFSGEEFIDKFSLGGLTIEKQSIGGANFTYGFNDVDGIFGVGPVGLTQGTVANTPEVPTVLNNLYSSKAIHSEVLGVYFKPISGSKTEEANGEISLGGADASKYSGALTYTPVTTAPNFSRYWGIDIAKVAYGSKTLFTSGHAIVDTGTTLIYLPQNAFAKFLNATEGSMDALTGLPAFGTKPTAKLSFNIGGKDLTLTPNQYLLPQAQYEHFGAMDGRYYAWLGTLGSVSQGDVDCIIGQKFLENYYSVYDTTAKRVGFATRK